ncbi:MAG: glycosyltransferase family 2 protein, partial [Thermodesulfobacteriota bacterium]
EDFDKERLRGFNDRFLLIENEENKGYSEGCNIGIRAALGKKCEAVLLLNTDARIEEEDVLLLLDILKLYPEIGVIGPLIYDAVTKRLINAGGKEIGWNYHTHHDVPLDKNELYDVDYVSGTAMLVRSDLFHNIGLLDARYFFSGEIADFCKRVKIYTEENGFQYRVVIHPGAKAFHDTHDPSKDREKLYSYYTIRNRYLYVRKFLKWYLPVLYPLWIYFHLKHAVQCIKEDRSDVARIIFKGIIHGVCGRAGEFQG